MTNSEHARALLSRYQQGLCSEEEKQLVEDWIDELEHSGELNWTEQEKEILGQKLKNRITLDIGIHLKKVSNTENASPVRRIYRIRVAAAICLLLIGAATAFLIAEKHANKTGSHVLASKPAKTIMPGTTGATLTLADGRQISLDSLNNGTVAMQGSAELSQQNGTLEYTSLTAETRTLIYNTINTGHGHEYKLTLSDGTKVWLNAMSSLKYPVVFTGHERTVEINGEAYFEVAEKRNTRGIKEAFTVKMMAKNTVNGEIQVLGTHFNVNAYDEEADKKVTLLEGSVRIAKQGLQPVLIKPGQQARINSDISVMDDADLEEAVAWKNGFFLFHNVNIQTVMRQAQRWYNITVAYPKGVPSDVLRGGISRKVNLSQFLDIIKYSEINVKIDNNVVEITPAETGRPTAH